MSKPLVYTVVLNWRGWRDTLECLESLRATTYPRLRVAVIDNASGDESVERIGSWIASRGGGRFELLQTDANLGYARGNNVGLRHALQNGADFIMILNNDTIVTPAFLEPLVAFAQEHPEAGILSGKVLDYTDRSIHQCGMRRRMDLFGLIALFSGLKRVLRRTYFVQRYFYTGDRPCAVYAVPGCAWMIRREALESAGLLDEQTFLYFEEFIMAEKIRRTPFKSYYVPASVVYHKGARSTSGLPRPERILAGIRSEQRYVRDFLRLTRLERTILKIVRWCAWTLRALAYPEFRCRYGEMLQVLRNY